MKKILLTIVVIPSLALLAFTLRSEPLPIGSPMPKADLKMKDVTGKEVTLNSVKTQSGLLVMFSCNTCPTVHRNQGRTKEICTYSLQKGLGVILVNSNEASRGDGDSYDDMKEYAKEQGYNWLYAVDKNNELADAFGADRTPECFLFDKSGKLAYHGAIDNNPSNANAVSRQHLKEAINEMLGGKDVSVKETRSVGCSIKRI